MKISRYIWYLNLEQKIGIFSQFWLLHRWNLTQFFPQNFLDQYENFKISRSYRNIFDISRYLIDLCQIQTVKKSHLAIIYIGMCLLISRNTVKNSMFRICRFLPTKRNKRIKENHEEIKTLLRGLIIKREKAIISGEARQDDLLGLLMESNMKAIKDGGNVKTVGMSIDEVIEECNLFYLAGQEAAATLLVWTLIVLCMHQDWQEKARAEVLQVFGGDTIEFEGLSQLKTVSITNFVFCEWQVRHLFEFFVAGYHDPKWGS